VLKGIARSERRGFVITQAARQLMGPPLESLPASDSVVTAARRMRLLGVSSVPVCGADNEFLGMVFERDIVQGCVAEAIDPGEMAVGRLLNLPQNWIDVDQPADSAVLRMILEQPLGLPVVEHGVLVGVITLAGIAAHLIEDDAGEDAAVQRWWPSAGAVE
jgi:CBS domain-containing protein